MPGTALSSGERLSVSESEALSMRDFAIAAAE